MHKVSEESLRIALIGAGRITQTYIQAFGVTDKAHVIAVVDTRQETVSSAAEALGCTGYNSCEALFAADLEIDAAIVATPPATHAAICVDLFNRGIPVLCEKPISVDLNSALNMREVAWRNDTIFTMASKFRYAEDVIKAKAIVDSGILGEIILVENTFMSCVDMRSRWNSNYAMSGGGVLIDNGTHSVDIMRYLLGPLSEIQVTEGRRTQGLEVEETVRASIRSVSGTIGTMDLSWSLTKETDDYIVIYGSSGTLRIGWKTSAYRQNGREWLPFGSGYDKVKAFKRQIENFCGAVRGTESLLITADDAIASVETIQVGYLALREKRWIQISAGMALSASAANGSLQTV